MTGVSAALAAGCAGLAATLLLAAPSSGKRLRGWTGRATVDERAATASPSPVHDRRRAFGRVAAAVITGVGVAVVVGGAIGLVAGALAGFGAHRTLARAGPAPAVPLDELALLCDLFAACLRSGATVPDALRWAGVACSPAWSRPFDEVASALLLGAAPAEAWALAGDAPPVRRLAEAARRSARSGAALADSCTALAVDLRDAACSEGQARARRVGVLMAGPLALCFLPAFALLGVVPFVAGLLRTVLP